MEFRQEEHTSKVNYEMRDFEKARCKYLLQTRGRRGMMKKNKEVGECIIKFMSSKPDGIPKVTEKRQYSFPRKAFIRFVVKDGKCFGSGGIKQYDEKRSFFILFLC